MPTPTHPQHSTPFPPALLPGPDTPMTPFCAAVDSPFTQPRAAYRASVELALPSHSSKQPDWNNSCVPTVRNIQDLLSTSLPNVCPSWATALHNGSAGSPLDGSAGNWAPVVTSLAAATPRTISGMSQAFTAIIAPLGTAPATRVKAWRNWCTVLTWATARASLHQILPMPPPVLQALLWEFTSLGATNSTLKSIVDAIITRHREAQLPSPLQGHTSYSRLTRCLARVLGRPHAHKRGITRDMVVALLRSHPPDLVAFRNKNATCTLTVGCMRPSEGAAALTCELEFNADYNAGLHQYRGCSTLHCLMRKNDQERKGHQMRFGVSSDSALDIPFQLGLFMDLAGTRPRTNCNGSRKKRCTVCPPLFPKLVKDASGAWVVAPNPTPSPALVSSMVSSALRTIGVDSSSFTGASCRMGGLTVASEAGVPESILWMQSGHAQSVAARGYVRLTNPDRLYDTWRAFRL